LDEAARPLAECSPQELWRGQLHLALATARHLVAQLAELEKQLDALGAADPQVQLLQTIPGVGPRSAEVIAAFIDRPQRFTSGRQVSAYAGLVPRQYQSGQTDRHGRITKRGPSLLRKMLVEVAWVMQRYNPWARQILARISQGQRTRKRQAAVALARKLLVRCWAMLGTARAGAVIRRRCRRPPECVHDPSSTSPFALRLGRTGPRQLATFSVHGSGENTAIRKERPNEGAARRIQNDEPGSAAHQCPETRIVDWILRGAAAKQYVYLWADGIHVNVRLKEEANQRQCLLVLMGPRPMGTRH
jgi:hypothetical protein